MSTLNYGFVLITQGKHKGHAAYYDDDKGESFAIVYFGAPCLSEFATVPRDYLEQISSKEAMRLGWRNEVRSRRAG